MEPDSSISTTRRLTFKHFVAEATPSADSIVSLKSHNSGKYLYLYLSGINAVLAIAPKLFKLLGNSVTEGPDEEIYGEEVKKYGNKKIMASVKRFRNKTSVCIHLMFDENNTGAYRHTQCQIQLSPEDNLEDLREFAQEAKRVWEAGIVAASAGGRPGHVVVDMTERLGEALAESEECMV